MDKKMSVKFKFENIIFSDICIAKIIFLVRGV